MNSLLSKLITIENTEFGKKLKKRIFEPIIIVHFVNPIYGAFNATTSLIRTCKWINSVKCLRKHQTDSPQITHRPQVYSYWFPSANNYACVYQIILCLGNKLPANEMYGTLTLSMVWGLLVNIRDIKNILVMFKIVFNSIYFITGRSNENSCLMSVGIFISLKYGSVECFKFSNHKNKIEHMHTKVHVIAYINSILLSCIKYIKDMGDRGSPQLLLICNFVIIYSANTWSSIQLHSLVRSCKVIGRVKCNWHKSSTKKN